MAFQGFLKQSTAVDVIIGPFLDDTDGKTAEPGLTISQADVKLSKNGQTLAQKSDITACTADGSDGYYNCELDATDTNTVGQLTIVVHEAGALPVRLDYHVVEEAVYDAMYGSSAAGPLQSTTAGRTLDVTATGAAGIDWGNVENQSTVVDLSATDIQLVDTATAVTNGVTLAAGAITNASLAGNMEVVFETDFATNYNITRNAWVTNAQDFVGTTASDPFNGQIVAASVTGAVGSVTAGVNLAAGAITNASLAENMEIVFETDFATNYNTTRNAWATNVQDFVGTTGADPFSGTVVAASVTGNVGGSVNSVTTGVTLAAGAITNASLAGNMEIVFETDFGTNYDTTNDAWVTNLGSTVGVGNLTVDVLAISGDTVAADNLEAMYDGTGYTDDTAPSSRAQVAGIGAASGGALNFANTADNVDAPIKSISFDGTETSGTNASTNAQDAVYHQITHAANNIDIVYEFDIGGNRTATEITWQGNLTGSNDVATIQVYNGSGWDTLSTINGVAGAPATTDDNQTIVIPLLSTHTGTGADLGKIFVRIECAAQTSPVLYTDLLLVAGVNIGQSVGYSDGAIWIDTINGVAGVEDFVNGVADNPVDSWADALTLSGSLGLNRFHIAGGSSITLTGDSTAYELVGNGIFDLNLSSQTVTDIYIFNANISGTGTGNSVEIVNCHIMAGASIPAGNYRNSGFLGTSGSPITESGIGEYILHNCFSEVAGSGTPHFNFAGAGGTVGFNNRGWLGGINFTGDSNVSVSHEVLAGGGTTINGNGGNVEVRGICRSLTLRMTDAETLQFVGITGPITLNDDGATTATVNLYGVCTSVTDNTTTATVSDNTVSRTNINIEADTAISDAFTFSGANVDANIAAIDAGTITAATIATDAIGSDELATSAVTEIRDAITGGSYALDTDANGRVRVVDGTGVGEINTAAGVVEANVAQVDSSTQAATNLKQSSLCVVTGSVVDDVANTATTFEVDSTLGAKAVDYFGNADGGMVLAFVDGTTNEWQTRRIVSFNTTTNFVTVEEAFDAEPVAAEAFVLLGRITELS